ncbi:MAG: molybdenum cofactor guanylyltransferase [Chloroflexota bacterium]|nr:molybdenum cofactor guanylyltransferase [Chloroflexota bacterium]
MFTIVIQAGGKSERMGKDKALLPFLGRPLIARVIDRVSVLGDETIVVANNITEYKFLNVPLYPDVIPNRGALGGLYTALYVSANPVVGLVACDMPFASPQLLAHLKATLQKTGADAVLPSTEGGLEPLHAVYRRETCLPLIKEAIKNGMWKMIGWHKNADVRVLSPEETKQYAPHPRVFWNLNTPQEFQKAEEEARVMNDE